MPAWVEAALVIAGGIAAWAAVVTGLVLLCSANRACADREMRAAGRFADGVLTRGSASTPPIPRRVTNWERRMERERQELLYDATAPKTTRNGGRP